MRGSNQRERLYGVKYTMRQNIAYSEPMTAGCYVDQPGEGDYGQVFYSIISNIGCHNSSGNRHPSAYNNSEEVQVLIISLKIHYPQNKR